MMTLNLWRAEWLKARKRPANRLILLFVNLIAFLFIVGVIVYSKATGKINDASAILPFPRSLDLAVNTIAGFSKLITVIFVSNAVGSEYSQDTWKMILPRYGSRSAFLITKVCSGLVGMVLFFATSVSLWVILSFIGTKLLGVPTTLSPSEQIINPTLKVWLLTMLEMVFYGSLTFLATIATRSVIGGIIGGLAGLTVLQIAGALPINLLLKILPTTHIDNLYGHWMTSQSDMMAIQTIFGYQLKPQISLAIIVVYILFLLGLSLFLFHRRDIAGQ